MVFYFGENDDESLDESMDGLPNIANSTGYTHETTPFLESKKSQIYTPDISNIIKSRLVSGLPFFRVSIGYAP